MSAAPLPRFRVWVALAAASVAGAILALVFAVTLFALVVSGPAAPVSSADVVLVAAMDLAPLVAVAGLALIAASLVAARRRVASVLAVAMPAAAIAAGVVWHPALDPARWMFMAAVVLAYWVGVAAAAVIAVLLVGMLVEEVRTPRVEEPAWTP